MNLPGEASSFVSVESVWSFLKAGGPVMAPIGLCSVVALAFAFERYAKLTRARACPKAFDDALAALSRDDAASALAACESVDAAGTRILAAGIRRRGFALTEIERAMEEQGAKEADRLRANVRPLGLIVSLAPLLGLFGTVVGIYEAFHVVARTNAMGNAQLLASGIEVALITTIAGLVVAIPVQCLHFHLLSRTKKLLGYVEERLSGAVERLARTTEPARAP